jgi:hypothetical protein
VRQLVGPLDRDHRSIPKLLEAEFVDFSRIVQAIEIDVQQRYSPAPVLLNQRESRAADVSRRRAKTFREAAHEGRFAGPEIAEQKDD